MTSTTAPAPTASISSAAVSLARRLPLCSTRPTRIPFAARKSASFRMSSRPRSLSGRVGSTDLRDRLAVLHQVELHLPAPNLSIARRIADAQ